MTKIDSNVQAAEKALLELLSLGKRISQHAVEKRAGLANGTLNYANPKYQSLKEKINRAKSASTPNKDPIEEKYKNLLVKERTLKNKYRTERNALKKQLQKAEGEKLELIYQLYHTQKYLSQFEKDGIIPTNILEFPRVNRESSH